MNKIKLYRFAENGFEPTYQQYHAQGIEQLCNTNNAQLNQYPEHLRQHILNNKQQVLPDWKNYAHGLFAFVGNLPDINTIDHLLNHLNREQKLSYQWWTAEISENEYCFQVSNSQLWRKSGLCQIKDIIKKQEEEIFIPSQFLNIENIHKIHNNLPKLKKYK